MPAMLGMRAFALAADRASGGVYCGADGVFVGDVPLLKHSGAPEGWLVRSSRELNDELTFRYRLPVDIAAKANALALIAHALNRGDLAMAAIATVQMQLPDPPTPSKSIETTEETLHRAADLYRSGLLKYGDWNPDKHPRTGVPPNPGWFATVEGSVERPWRVAANDLPEEEDEIKPPLLSERPRHEGEIRPLQIMPRGLPPFPGGLPRLLPSTRPAPEGPSPGGSRSPAPAPGAAQPKLPFPGGLPPQLAPYVLGGKTSGILQTSNATTVLESGAAGPAAAMPPGSAGFDAYTKTHVEGHAAALMRQEESMKGTLRINNPEICDSCTRLLPSMLSPGAVLLVILPDGTIHEFRGAIP